MGFQSIFELYERLSGKSASNPAFDIAVARGDSLRDAGLAGRAITEYQEALRMRPDSTFVLVQIGNMAKDTQQFELARASYEKAVQSFSDQARALPEDDRRDALRDLADVYCQLGHLHKLMNDPYTALDYYRECLSLDQRPEVAHDLRHLETVAADIASTSGLYSSQARFGQLRGTNAVIPDNAPPTQIDFENLMSDEFDKITIRKSSYECFCYSSNYHERSKGWVECRTCGSRYSKRLHYINERGIRIEPPQLEISADDIKALFARYDITPTGNRIGLLNGVVPDAAAAGLELVSVPIYSDGLADRGQPRVAYDVLVLPNASLGISNLAGILRDCMRILRPGGVLILGYRAKGAADGGATLPDYRIGTPDQLFYQFSMSALLKAMRIEEQNGEFLGEAHLAGHAFLAMCKARTLSMGIMSGIGDAAWSLLFAEGMMRKHGVSDMVLHVHHSGDFRARRSNNMLARFSFVKELAASKFDIHASPPMNDATGHINYIPSGPVPLDSTDEFDYRLVFNTFFEHGWSVKQIAERFGLTEADVNFSFFDSYIEKPEDLRGYNRMINFTGQDYIIFHYGALNTNTEDGLNRGEIWRPEDWNALGRMLHENYGCKIVIIGAAYDLEYARRVQAATMDAFYFNTIGQMDITETLAVIRRARMVVSFPSGVGIVGPYFNVPTCIFWRPKDNPYHPLHPRSGFEPEFSHNWVPPARLDDKSYYPAWYGEDTPQSIFNQIVDNDWWNRGTQPALKASASRKRS